MKFLIPVALLALVACDEQAKPSSGTQIALPVASSPGVTAFRKGNVTTIIGSLN